MTNEEIIEGIKAICAPLHDCRALRDKIIQELTNDHSDWYTLTVKINPFSGYSGAYAAGVMEFVENAVRVELDRSIGYLNDKQERNYTIERTDYT